MYYETELMDDVESFIFQDAVDSDLHVSYEKNISEDSYYFIFVDMAKNELDIIYDAEKSIIDSRI